MFHRETDQGADCSRLQDLSRITESLLGSPFEWCLVRGGTVTIEDASDRGGTAGGKIRVVDFALAKYPITNTQYQRFLDDPSGYPSPIWWAYSLAAIQWRKDHPSAKPTAFGGAALPRTRVSWFDALAFCAWLSSNLEHHLDLAEKSRLDPGQIDTWRVRLPTEEQWQRAAIGESKGPYPWGHHMEEKHCNYGDTVGQPTRVGSHPDGQSPFGVLDMVGNVWEWCLTAWGVTEIDLSGYTYRLIKGGAWNVSNPDHLRATDRGANSPRGQLNDCGFRVALIL